jgi:hypothetical protein
MERVETEFIGIDPLVDEKSKTTGFPAGSIASLARKCAHETPSSMWTPDMRK